MSLEVIGKRCEFIPETSHRLMQKRPLSGCRSQIMQEETAAILPHLKCFNKLSRTRALGAGISVLAGSDPGME